MTAVTTDGVFKRCGVEVAAKGFVALVGPSDCGKSVIKPELLAQRPVNRSPYKIGTQLQAGGNVVRHP